MNSSIGEVCSRFSSGTALPAKDIHQTGLYPVYGGNGIRGYTDTYNFDGRCAIIGRQGALCGNVRYFEGKAFMTEHAIVAVANDKNDSGYLAYKLMIMNLGKYQGQSAQPGLSVTTLSRLPIRLPDLATQRKVFSFLNTLSNKIINNTAVISQLESLAKTIYDYWFLQFEFPNEEGKPYKSSGGKMVWCEELKREIPEGWEAKKISTLIDRDKGGDWGKEAKTGNYVEKVTCIRGADFPSAAGGELLDAPERWILSKNIGKEVAYGDIMIEISGGSPTQSTGRICYANHNFLRRTDNPIISSNFCRTISLLNPDAYSWFYVMWKSLYDIGLFFNYEGKTTGIKNLLFDTVVTNVSIPFPNNTLIDQYCEIVNNIFETIQEKSFENAQLSSLRNFLLPMLMNGQVTFKDN